MLKGDVKGVRRSTSLDRLEKVLVEHAGILNAQDKAAAVAAIASAREAMGGTGEDKLRQAVEHLAQASTRIEEAAAAALRTRGAPTGGPGDGAPSAAREEAVDAEFEEVGHR